MSFKRLKTPGKFKVNHPMSKTQHQLQAREHENRGIFG